MSDAYRRYWGLCEDNGHPPVTIIAEVGPGAEPDATIPDPDEWESFGLRCPVCDETVPGRYEGADNATSDRQRTTDLRNGAEHGAQTATDVLRGIALRAANDPSGVLHLATRVDRVIADQPDQARVLAASGREHRER